MSHPHQCDRHSRYRHSTIIPSPKPRPTTPTALPPLLPFHPSSSIPHCQPVHPLHTTTPSLPSLPFNTPCNARHAQVQCTRNINSQGSDNKQATLSSLPSAHIPIAGPYTDPEVRHSHYAYTVSWHGITPTLATALSCATQHWPRP